jgi:hypothetical protein
MVFCLLFPDTLKSGMIVSTERAERAEFHPPESTRKEVLAMRGVRLTIKWARGSISITLEPH